MFVESVAWNGAGNGLQLTGQMRKGAMTFSRIRAPDGYVSPFVLSTSAAGEPLWGMLLSNDSSSSGMSRGTIAFPDGEFLVSGRLRGDESASFVTPTAHTSVDGWFPVASDGEQFFFGRAAPSAAVPEQTHLVLPRDVYVRDWTAHAGSTTLLLARAQDHQAIGLVSGSLGLGSLGQSTAIVRIDAAGSLEWVAPFHLGTQLAYVEVLPSGRTAATVYTNAGSILDRTGQRALSYGFNTLILDGEGQLLFARPGRLLGETSAGDVLLRGTFQRQINLETAEPGVEDVWLRGPTGFSHLYVAKYDAGGLLSSAQVIASTPGADPEPAPHFAAERWLVDGGIVFTDTNAAGAVWGPNGEHTTTRDARVFARFDADLNLMWVKELGFTHGSDRALVRFDGTDTWLLGSDGLRAHA